MYVVDDKRALHGNTARHQMFIKSQWVSAANEAAMQTDSCSGEAWALALQVTTADDNAAVDAARTALAGQGESYTASHLGRLNRTSNYTPQLERNEHA